MLGTHKLLITNIFFSFCFQDDIIQPVRDALDYYTNMQNVMEDEKRRKEDDSGGKSSEGKNGLRHSGKMNSALAQ